MRVLITGGAGFIGLNLVKALTAEHGGLIDIIVLDDMSNVRTPPASGGRIRFVQGSVLDKSILVSCCDGIDAVVHLAALGGVSRSVADPEASIDVNVLGTMNVLQVLRGRPHTRFILASSSSVYGSNPTFPRTESLDPRPVSPYAASKLAAEALTLAWASSYNLQATVFRLFNVFGPGQRADILNPAVIPALVHSSLQGTPFSLYGDGAQTRDFTYVKDVCWYMSRALAMDRQSAAVYNVARGSAISIMELIRLVESVGGRSIDVWQQPQRQADVINSIGDSTALEGILGKAPTRPLRQQIAATIAAAEHEMAF